MSQSRCMTMIAKLSCPEAKKSLCRGRGLPNPPCLGHPERASCCPLKDELTISVGRRVYWNDPDRASRCSGWGRVVRLQYQPVDADCVISLKMDDGGEVECLRNELRLR